MLSYEGIGKTIEKAIEDALLVLKAPREDCDIKILEEGGLFKKARVLVSISEDCQEKYQEKKAKLEDVDVNLNVKELLSQEAGKKEKMLTKSINPVVENAEEKVVEEQQDQRIEKQQKRVEREKIDDIKCVEFLKGLCDAWEIEANIECFREGDRIIVSVSGDNVSGLIGYRGDCLNGLQYLLNVVEQRREGERTKIVLDIENYREKRESTLVSLANRMARKVAKTHHQIKLEPMTPNERRIIHTALQNDAYVTTFSKGSEPNRYLVIAPKH